MIKKLILIAIAIVFIGCNESNDEGILTEEEKIPYDIYWCSSISISSIDGSTKYESGIYGVKNESLETIHTILSFDTFIDSCTVDDDGNIYWGDRTKKAIFKADRKGSNVKEIISNLDIPLGLAIDNKNKRIYWSNWLQSNDPQSGEIGYANLDGTEQNIIIDEGLSSGGSILVDFNTDKLYVSDIFGKKIVKTGLEGGTLDTIVTSDSPHQFDIDYENSKLIWTDVADDAIYSINLDSTDKTTLISFDDIFANPSSLSIDQKNNKLYFDSRGSGVASLSSSNLDGSDIKLLNSSLKIEVQSLWIAN
jgi:hypothetical protein